jgi:uncharacterized Fe-S radical SAM superfamily protein PflX
LTKSEVQILKDFMTSPNSYDKDFYELMKKVDTVSEELWNTTGDEVWSVVDFVSEYCRTYILYNLMSKYIPTLNFNDEDELKEQISEIIFNDDNLWEEVLKLYIKTYYR